MRFYLNTTKEIPSLVILASTDDITNREKQLKLRHESPQELQNWNLVMLEAYNQAMQSDAEKDADELAQYQAKRKVVFESYIQNEVQFVHHLQGLIPILGLEPEPEAETEIDSVTPRVLKRRAGEEERDPEKEKEKEKEKERLDKEKNRFQRRRKNRYLGILCKVPSKLSMSLYRS